MSYLVRTFIVAEAAGRPSETNPAVFQQWLNETSELLGAELVGVFGLGASGVVWSVWRRLP